MTKQKLKWHPHVPGTDVEDLKLYEHLDEEKYGVGQVFNFGNPLNVIWSGSTKEQVLSYHNNIIKMREGLGKKLADQLLYMNYKYAAMLGKGEHSADFAKGMMTQACIIMTRKGIKDSKKGENRAQFAWKHLITRYDGPAPDVLERHDPHDPQEPSTVKHYRQDRTKPRPRSNVIPLVKPTIH